MGRAFVTKFSPIATFFVCLFLKQSYLSKLKSETLEINKVFINPY